MAGKYFQGMFIPKNPEKYVGISTIYYRSSWECKLMQMLDMHPSIVSWASESIRIPYTNPFTGKPAIYIPDFLIVYDDVHGKRHAEIVEVKPLKESSLVEAKSKRDKAAVALNMYKWAAARQWASHHSMTFRVMTEFDIFNNPSKKRK